MITQLLVYNPTNIWYNDPIECNNALINQRGYTMIQQTQPEQKIKLQSEIDRLTQEFLQRGGEIQKCPTQYSYMEKKFFSKEITKGEY